MRYLIILLFVAGCGLIAQPLPHGDRHGEVDKVLEINYLSTLPECDKAFSSALSYYYSHGIKFKVSKNADKQFTCLPCAPIWIRTLSPFYEQGLQQGNIAYARMCGNENHRANLVAHEIAHLFTNNGHSQQWRDLLNGDANGARETNTKNN